MGRFEPRVTNQLPTSKVTRVISAVVILALAALGSGYVTALGQKQGKNSKNPSQTTNRNTGASANQNRKSSNTLNTNSLIPQPADSYTATAYCLKGRTASGKPTERGMIAADVRVLPLGSVVKIHAGKYSGIYHVADTGSKIKGNKIDVFVPSKAEAVKFGRQKIKVEVLQHGRSVRKPQTGYTVTSPKR
ncbi:MAG: 3D domain-containing protein [Acidobacteria bacterium]|nr:3D domain-containing protein [Acidobacteriota bacterium]